jgi:hypothetical protein
MRIRTRGSSAKPKGMGWAVHDRWVTFYDVGEEMLDEQLVKAAAWLMSGCG